MSVTTTQKGENFMATPLQDVKKITDCPGVGPASAKKLDEANIDTPVKLMGHFMVSRTETVGVLRAFTRCPPARPFAAAAVDLDFYVAPHVSSRTHAHACPSLVYSNVVVGR